jgi:hypothetical protein
MIAKKPKSKEAKEHEFISRGSGPAQKVDTRPPVQVLIQMPKDLSDWLAVEAKKLDYSRRTYITRILLEHRKQVEKGLA